MLAVQRSVSFFWFDKALGFAYYLLTAKLNQQPSSKTTAPLTSIYRCICICAVTWARSGPVETWTRFEGFPASSLLCLEHIVWHWFKIVIEKPFLKHLCGIKKTLISSALCSHWKPLYANSKDNVRYVPLQDTANFNRSKDLIKHASLTKGNGKPWSWSHRQTPSTPTVRNQYN